MTSSREEVADALVDRVRGILEILLLVLLAELHAFVLGVQLAADNTRVARAGEGGKANRPGCCDAGER